MKLLSVVVCALFIASASYANEVAVPAPQPDSANAVTKAEKPHKKAKKSKKAAEEAPAAAAPAAAAPAAAAPEAPKSH